MSELKQSHDRRQFGRRQTRFEGWILVPGKSRISCFVSNISETGARIELHDDIFLPYKFQLELPDQHIRIYCETKHTGRRYCGVQFCLDTAVETPGRKTKSMITDADYWRG